MSAAPRLDQWTDFDYQGAPSADDLEDLEAQAAEKFIASTPSFYASEWNAEVLTHWLDSQNAPATIRNLQIAHRECAVQLERRPPSSVPDATGHSETAVNPSIVGVVSDRIAVWDPSDAERKALAKCADSPVLNDHQRKGRDRLLAHLAHAQRREFADSRPPGPEPRMVI
jgi:hypothetical protein